MEMAKSEKYTIMEGGNPNLTKIGGVQSLGGRKMKIKKKWKNMKK